MTEPAPFPSERTAVLTGAASARGIGRATADRLASQGWSIGIVDINADDAKAAAAEMAPAGRQGHRGGRERFRRGSVARAISEIEADLPPDRRAGQPGRHQLPDAVHGDHASRNGTRCSRSTCAGRSSSPSACSRA